MANETTTTTIDDLIQRIIGAALIVRDQSVYLADIEYIDKRPVPLGKGGVDFPEWDALTFAQLTEATDMSNQAASTTGQSIDLSEVGGMTTITDLAMENSAGDSVSDISQLFGQADRAFVNQTVWALFDGFSNAVGGSNTNITEAIIAEAIRILMINQAPRPYYLAITPFVWEDLIALYSTNTSNTAEQIRNQVLLTGVAPPIYGVVPLVIDNLASGTSTGKISAADAKCGLFSRRAIGAVERKVFGIEKERDASLRAWELNAVHQISIAEVKDAWGVEVLVDNQDP